MTSVPAPATTSAPIPTDQKAGKVKKWFIVAAFFGLFFALVGVFGSEGRNETFSPASEFELPAWIAIEIGGIDLSINKATFYILVAALFTIVSMLIVARRMQARPNRVQTAVETVWQFTANNVIGDSMHREHSRKWFPFILALFMFIWWSNMIGYIPLPTNTHHPVEILGIEVPSLALYAATANLSVPLILALVVWFISHYEGIRALGVGGYFKSWIPAGTPTLMLPFMVFIEVLGQIVRPVSLAVRLFANVLVGHLLLLFMGGGLAIILGVSAIGLLTLPLAVAFFLFEVGLIASLQAFIFASLAANYIGSAVDADH